MAASAPGLHYQDPQRVMRKEQRKQIPLCTCSYYQDAQHVIRKKQCQQIPIWLPVQLRLQLQLNAQRVMRKEQNKPSQSKKVHLHFHVSIPKKLSPTDRQTHPLLESLRRKAKLSAQLTLFKVCYTLLFKRLRAAQGGRSPVEHR